MVETESFFTKSGLWTTFRKLRTWGKCCVYTGTQSLHQYAHITCYPCRLKILTIAMIYWVFPTCPKYLSVLFMHPLICSLWKFDKVCVVLTLISQVSNKVQNVNHPTKATHWWQSHAGVGAVWLQNPALLCCPQGMSRLVHPYVVWGGGILSLLSHGDWQSVCIELLKPDWVQI